MKKSLLFVFLLCIGCNSSTEPNTTKEGFKTIPYSESSWLYEINYQGKTYLVNPNGGIVEHLPQQ